MGKFIDSSLFKGSLISPTYRTWSVFVPLCRRRFK